MAKFEEHEKHPSHERWLVSYADFMTLLFAFFVVMYAVSAVDQKRALQVEKSVRWALNVAGKGGGQASLNTDPRPEPPQPSRKPKQQTSGGAEAKANHVKRVLERSGISAARPSVLVFAIDTSLIVRVGVEGLFPANGTVMEPTALAMLDQLLAEIGALKKNVRIEGHTDADGTSIRSDPNWALSAARAAAIASYAQAIGAIPGPQLSVAAYGSSRPIATNDTPEGRARNRRIELVVMMIDGEDPWKPPMRGASTP
jgi:chemotaxis protein MotB